MAVDQEGFRWRNDDGTEATASWLITQDVNLVRPISTNTRLRVLLNATGTTVAEAYRIDYKKSTYPTYGPILLTQPAQVINTYTTTGAGTWLCPPYVTSVVVECWGPGGAGSRSATNTTGRGGGGGGSYARRNALSVTPGTTYSFTIGAGGTDGATPATGANTVFTGNVGVTCTGRAGASVAANTSAGTAGAVAQVADGDVYFNGGNGAAGTSGAGGYSGGGGEGGCSNATGANAVGMTGGASVNDGGNGANGRNTAGIGAAGTAPGGGGAGGYRTNNTRAGGVGGAGQVRVTYTQVHPVLISGSANVAAGGAITAARLLPPGVKTTAVFTAGRIRDDANGTDSINIGTDRYAEMEWSLVATAGAANGDVYQFRVTVGGTALATYTATPQWTVGTPSGTRIPVFLNQYNQRWGA